MSICYYPTTALIIFFRNWFEKIEHFSYSNVLHFVVLISLKFGKTINLSIGIWIGYFLQPPPLDFRIFLLSMFILVSCVGEKACLKWITTLSTFHETVFELIAPFKYISSSWEPYHPIMNVGQHISFFIFFRSSEDKTITLVITTWH